MGITPASSSFFLRNEFLLRRLFSLTGLVPVGAYMVIHLITNASVLNGAATYQNAVYTIHGLGIALPIIEWGFIFIPLLFHALIGLVVIRGSQPNTASYPYGSNVRYTLQRATGLIALVFILWHVFHMHGWIHAEWWTDNIRDLNGGMFRPYNAASSTARAMTVVPLLFPVLYLIGLLACIFHLANGIWSFGITWGIWTTPASMRRAGVACAAFGLLLTFVGLGAWAGPILMARDAKKLEEATAIEDRMYEENTRIGRIEESEHKRYDDEERQAFQRARQETTTAQAASVPEE